MTGSSPRGRGTLVTPAGHVAVWRFIPAWAGNTWCRPESNSRSPVHPRVGGEHYPDADLRRHAGGSSPRGRGTRVPLPDAGAIVRFIPAWAGNTAFSTGFILATTVHPRVGGEHPSCAARHRICCGSSPRGRGTRLGPAGLSGGGRFIPAWAGNTPASRTIPATPPVHPRVGGEHSFFVTAAAMAAGSSPRGRGTRLGHGQHELDQRFIPAWAGNTGRSAPPLRFRTVHPRVGGEHTYEESVDLTNAGSSPRGRGTPQSGGEHWRRQRFIPAWAGNTYRTVPLVWLVPVHPRVGGEHLFALIIFLCSDGSSPRGRGTRYWRVHCPVSVRFIPAWAGNTG